MTSFGDIVCDNHSLDVACHCGRIWFTKHSEQYEEYAEKSKSSLMGPYCESSDDAIGWGVLDGRQVVFDCPCGFIEKYEAFLLQHEEVVRKFLRATGEDRMKEARRMAGIIV